MHELPPPRMRTRIKFCGVTRPGDARLAAELGVDAVGVIFAARSRRRVDLATVTAVREALPPLVALVALFMDNSEQEVRQAIRLARPTLLQFHGSEDDAFCRRFGLPYLKGVGLAGAPMTAQALYARWPHAAGFVLDGHAPGEPGGSGQRLDAASVPADLDRPWLLAGGLTADTVATAIHALRPWGVDVAGGIEVAPGIKDGDKMRRFVAAVRAADVQAHAAAGIG
jgi:phosphoribosylanthranilate isomerase